MKIVDKAVKTLIIISLGLVTLPVLAGESSWWANQVGGGTQITVTNASVAGHFCYLSRVTVRDPVGVHAGCEIRPSGLVWVLKANVGANAIAWCKARCYHK